MTISSESSVSSCPFDHTDDDEDDKLTLNGGGCKKVE